MSILPGDRIILVSSMANAPLVNCSWLPVLQLHIPEHVPARTPPSLGSPPLWLFRP